MADEFGFIDTESAKRLQRALRAFETEPVADGVEPPAGLVPLDMPPAREFELKTGLTPGGNATAFIVRGGEITEEEFQVYDRLGLHRGRGKDVYSTPHNDGSRGVAKYDLLYAIEDGNPWSVDSMQPSALMVKGALTADISGGTFDIDNVSVMQPIGGLITATDPAEDLTVANRSFDGDENSIAIAVWTGSGWLAIDVICPV